MTQTASRDAHRCLHDWTHSDGRQSPGQEAAAALAAAGPCLPLLFVGRRLLAGSDSASWRCFFLRLPRPSSSRWTEVHQDTDGLTGLVPASVQAAAAAVTVCTGGFKMQTAAGSAGLLLGRSQPIRALASDWVAPSRGREQTDTSRIHPIIYSSCFIMHAAGEPT